MVAKRWLFFQEAGRSTGTLTTPFQDNLANVYMRFDDKSGV